MKTSRASLLLLGFCLGCGSVNSPDDKGAPVLTITASLTGIPATDVDPEKLRATLVWINQLDYLHAPVDCFTQDCEYGGAGHYEVSTTDVRLAMSFPLQVKLELFELPTPLRGRPAFVEEVGPNDPIYSMPDAEVVVYEDRNGNGRLDLLPLGQPGPAVDRVLALSSGTDEAGNGVRTSIIYKVGPLPTHSSLYPGRSLNNPVPWLNAANGLYAVRIVGDTTHYGQSFMNHHSLGRLWVDPAWDVDMTPVEETTITLFPVTQDRHSWLARACEPLISRSLFSSGEPLPTPGSVVQCGNDALVFASHPDDYCNQGSSVDGPPQPGWPCDQRGGGLLPGAPYRAATSRLDVRYGFFSTWEDAPNWFESCDPGAFVHLDDAPTFRVPTLAPPAGSQVFCRSYESLSYVPPSEDGCLHKFTYDLASTLYADYGLYDPYGPIEWDLRDNPPSWWPCDREGKLRPDSGYVPPAEITVATCTTFQWELIPPAGPLPLPPGTRVRCESAEELVYLRDWAGPCERPQRVRTKYTASYEDPWSYEDGFSPRSYWEITPTWWPCDEAGKPRPDSPYPPL